MSVGAISPASPILSQQTSTGNAGHQAGQAADEEARHRDHRQHHKQDSEQAPPATHAPPGTDAGVDKVA
jgi:hypothetical protein